MSIFSSSTLNSPSILKTNSSVMDNVSILKTPSRVRFSLPQTDNISQVLENYLNEIDSKAYGSLIDVLKQSDLSVSIARLP